jgi:hypothetical protein
MNAAPSTAREALLAELLGDIGLLHDTVEQLKNDLPKLTQVYVADLEKATLAVGASVAELGKLAQATRDLSGQLSAQVEGLATLELGQMTTEKMRVHTQTYLDALSREVSKMATNEVSKQFRKLSNSPVQMLTVGGVVILLLIELFRVFAK